MLRARSISLSRFSLPFPILSRVIAGNEIICDAKHDWRGFLSALTSVSGTTCTPKGLRYVWWVNSNSSLKRTTNEADVERGRRTLLTLDYSTRFTVFLYSKNFFFQLPLRFQSAQTCLALYFFSLFHYTEGDSRSRIRVRRIFSVSLLFCASKSHYRAVLFGNLSRDWNMINWKVTLELVFPWSSEISIPELTSDWQDE